MSAMHKAAAAQRASRGAGAARDAHRAPPGQAAHAAQASVPGHRAMPSPLWAVSGSASSAAAGTAPRLGAGRCACGGGCPRCQQASAGTRPAATAASATPATAPVQTALPAPLSTANAARPQAPARPRAQATPRAEPLRLGHHDDAEETAAERVASRVTGLTARHSAPHATSDQTLARIDAHAPLRSPGQPIPVAQRRALEGHLHADFSAVRLHRGAAANSTAAALGARAYALGPHIVLGAGTPALHSPAGLHLLAHELAHTRQAGAAGTVRRLPSDYEINALPVGAAFDSGSIFFERGGEAIVATEQPKIAAMATPPGRDLTLHGFSSEDALPADRLLRVNARLAAVDAALAAAGHTGRRVLVPHPDSGVGNLDYRSMRAVQVLATPAGAVSAPTSVNPCEAAGSEAAAGAELAACEASFNAAFPTALAVVNAAERDIVTTPTAAANAVVARFFAGVPRAVVDTNVSAVAAQVRRLPSAHTCHTACDGGCVRPAFNTGQGVAARPGGALMTLCPPFVTAGLPFRIQTLIHESSHAVAGSPIVDVAYSTTRLIPFLLPADSQRNTDSYVLLMRLVHSPGSMGVGPVAADTVSGMAGTGAGSDTEQAQRAVAWLESWLNYGGFDTGVLYATLGLALQAGSWVTTGPNEFNIQTMHRLAQAFPGDLTDPGADGSARTTPPAPMATNTDKLRVAALHDRFTDLYQAVNQRPISITRGAAGSNDSWGSASSRPYLQPTVTVAPSFFALTPANQVVRLVQTMVRAHRDISGSFEAKYVQAIDLIHTHRRLGP